MKKSSNKKDNTLPRDGVKSLVTNFGGPKEFIKKVIEDCYFFDKSIMEKQFDFIKDNLNLCL